MRLICPNCGAQYAIADDVIPAAGRDVQCSNCAHTWFEKPGESEARDVAAAPRRPRPITGEVSTADAEPTPQPAGERRKVDPSVADILREEAARETQKRQNEVPAAPVESQADLGLSDPAKPRRERPDPIPDNARAAAATAAASVGAVAAAAEPTSRKSRLPDIEEINSSLESQSGGTVGTSEGVAQEVRERRGFRRAFVLVLLIFAALVAVYVQADAIKGAVPALAGAVDSYVAIADAGRIWLDDTVRGLLGPAAEGTASDS